MTSIQTQTASADATAGGLSPLQKFRASAGTYDLLYGDLVAKINGKEVDVNDSATFAPLVEAHNLCSELYAEVVKTHADGALFDEYGESAVTFARYILHLTSLKVNALKGKKQREDTKTRVNALIPLERQLVERGYKAPMFQDWLAAARTTGLPKAIWGKLFVQRAEGEEIVKPFLLMKTSSNKFKL